MRGDTLINCIDVSSVGIADLYIRVLEPEARIDVGRDLGVCLEDVFDVDVNEVVEGVDMLLDETFDLEKRGEQEPFVLRRLICQSHSDGRRKLCTPRRP